MRFFACVWCDEAACASKAICSVCGAEYGDINPNNHKAVTAVAAKDPTCTVNGNIEYWYCTACGKYFSDEACTNEIAYEDTIIPVAGHKAAVKNVIPATCETDGNAGDIYCSVCGQLLSTNNIIPKLGHNYVDGVCTNCGEADPATVEEEAPAEDASSSTSSSSSSAATVVIIVTVVVVVAIIVIVIVVIAKSSKGKKNGADSKKK